MPCTPGRESSAKAAPPRSPDDDFLISSMLGGDATALRKLMQQYDRLVRYTIFRVAKTDCLKDPQWLDSVASATWAGFVRSMRRGAHNRPKSIAAYLAQVARNQCASELRRAMASPQPMSLEDDPDTGADADSLEEPVELLSRMEDVEALRTCLAELDGEEKAMVSQLSAITDRKWREAARVLGLSESTLRSRWQRTLERLRRCVAQKTRESVAPARAGGD